MSCYSCQKLKLLVVCGYNGHRQLELLSMKSSIEQELDIARADMKQKNSVIDRLRDEVTMTMLNK